MAEPTSTGVVVAGAFGAGLAGMLAGINTEAAVGALCGAMVYFATTQELPVVRRLTFLLVSFVMGYLGAPALAKAEVMGIGPIEFPGPAAFICSALVITVTLAAIRRRGEPGASHG